MTETSYFTSGALSKVVKIAAYFRIKINGTERIIFSDCDLLVA